MSSLRAGLAVLAFATSVFGQTTYYVAPAGADTNAGTSRSYPWRTLARAGELRSGDRLLLAGGATFSGSIHVPSSNITIASYGTGRATIDSGDASGIIANGVGGLRVSNIALRGTSRANNVLERNGIEVVSTASRLNAIAFDHVEISGYNSGGITIRAGDRLTGFDGITIDSAYIHDNRLAGIGLYGDGTGVFRDVAIRHSEITEIGGYTTPNGNVLTATANGIIAQGIITGTIANNLIHENGTPFFGGAAYGLELVRSIDVAIEENEIRTMQSLVGNDAGGIDIDGSSQIRVRYNYTHDNNGPGIRLCGCSAPLQEITAAYNVSENDGPPASIDIEGSSGDAINVFNNTVSAGNGTGVAVTAGMRALVANNLLMTDSGTSADVTSLATMTANDYFDTTGSLRLRFNGALFTSAAAWARDSRWISADPQISGGIGGALLPAKSLSDLTPYRTVPASPLVDHAVDLHDLGIDPGTRDYYGGDSATLYGSDVGAYEYRREPYAPSLVPIASATVEVGDAIDADVWVRDADGTDDVVLSLVNPPPFVSLRRAGGNHAVITIAPLFAGQATIRVRATDGTGGIDETSFVVTATGGTRTRPLRRR